MKQKLLQAVLTVLVCASAHAVILNSTNDFNYFDYAWYTGPEVRYSNSVAGIFESSINGVLVHASRSRGDGTIISKSAYTLAGGTAEYIWSGSGGSSFMQIACGVITKPWPTDANNTIQSMLLTEYGNLYAGNWLGIPGRVYKTTITFTASSYALQTIDNLTGQIMATSSGSFDFTTPTYIYIGTGDTYDYLNAYLLLKSLKLLANIGPAPTPPTVVQTNRTPSSTEFGIQTSGSFKVFTNGAFTNGIALDPSKKTIVLTHGWNSRSDDWPTSMASQFVTAGISANLVAWDWRDDAKSDVTLTGARTVLLKTPAQGYALGSSLLQNLGAGYNQPIHFIGHSFGTEVNAAAANYLTNSYSSANMQMTLLDEAEIANLTRITPTTFNLSWIKPLPDNFAWSDNYISLVGELQENAKSVNIILTEGQPGAFYISANDLLNDMTAYHAVPCQWYAQTITNPSGSVMGNIWSFERNSNFTSPAGGTFFEQQGSGLVLNQIPQAIAEYLQGVNAVAFKRNLGVYLTLKVVNASVQVAGDVTANVIETALTEDNQVYQTTPATIGISTYASATPDFWSPQLILQNHPFIPPAPLITFKGKTPKDSSSTSSNSPAYAWLPMTIPTNATSMSFDFTIQGDGAGDSFDAALNGTNVFSLATSLIQTNVTLNSGLIDVSSYAGQNVELFLGIVGGASTNTVLTVSGIRLYSIASPLLQAQVSGNNCVLSWPLSAADYVLQTSTNLTDTNSWTAVPNVPAIMNLQNAVTNSTSDGVRFYRLKK